MVKNQAPLTGRTAENLLYPKDTEVKLVGQPILSQAIKLTDYWSFN